MSNLWSNYFSSDLLKAIFFAIFAVTFWERFPESRACHHLCWFLLFSWNYTITPHPPSISFWTLLASASISGPTSHSLSCVHYLLEFLTPYWDWKPPSAPKPVKKHIERVITFCQIISEELFTRTRYSPYSLPCQSSWPHSLLKLTNKNASLLCPECDSFLSLE